MAYGSKDFYTSQKFSPYDTYTDINKVINTQTGETESALKVGGLDLTGVTDPVYTDDSYSDLAIIPIDTSNPDVVGTATRGFQVKHNTITFGENNTISFLNKASITAEEDIGGATITIVSDSLSDKNDGYYYGTLNIDQVKKDIIGDIVMDYDYGLQVNVQFIGMDIKGDGSDNNPFQISEPKHFAVVRALRDKSYIQMKDIDLSSQYGYSEDVLSPLWADSEGFEPIGTKNAPFVGSYDGQGYLIENLYISAANTDNVGLFGYVKGNADAFASISNVHIELAGEMSVCHNPENLEEVTVIYGNVTGKENVGGLAGSAVNATITNCSVVKGNVIGTTAVGGLVGNAASSTINSCFTSTTAYAHYDLSSNIASAKTAGGLVGTVSGSLGVNNSFTLGFAALDPYKVGNTYYNYGSVGGFVGYVGSGAALTIDNAFVGAGVSDSVGNYTQVNGVNVSYRGLTVGAGTGSVTASNIFVSAAAAAGESMSGENVTGVVNPVYGTASGAAIGENVKFDSGLNGELINRTETDTASAMFSGNNGIALGVAVSYDAYTAAYVEFASLEISASDNEISDRGTTYQLGGLFYPLTVKDTSVEISASTVDTADKSNYPAEMDVEFFGNGDSKNTDLLFKSTESGIAVYLNVYDMAIASDARIGTYNNGTPHENGELFYNCALPYFTVEKQSGNYELYRKVTYPVQSRYEDGGRIYPIATERQLNAVAGYETSGTFGSFSKTANYALVEDITLGNYDFKPISSYTGNFNGKGHTVKNLTINQSGTDNVGFFAELTSSTVKNLHIEVKSVVGNNNVGGLVGHIGLNDSDPSKTMITGCSVSQQEGGSGIVGNQYVGGLVGYAICGIKTTDSNGNEISAAGISDSNTDISVAGSNIVGGLAGYSELFINNSYSTGDVNAAINADDDAPRGIGGLVGVLANESISTAYPSQITNSFSSSAVDVSNVTGFNIKGNGVGGLVGNVATGTSISTVFSSGSVRFCYGDDVDPDSLIDCTNTQALGIGGLVGVLNSDTSNVYSAASVAAKVGKLTSSSVVGIGGVAGIANVTISSAYSSGSTLGMTATTGDLSGYNYGVGGVVGLVSSNASKANNLYYDRNVSAVSETAVGKSNAAEGNLTNVSYKSTKEFTFVEDKENGFLGGNFQYTDGAYPYLSNFFADDVSLVIRLNALLSIVAIQLNELDQTAASGEGISMAMTIPTDITHDGVVYTYGFAADNSFGDSATSIVDKATNTLSVQRTSNNKEQANFIITVEAVNGNASTADGVVYSQVASRPLSRVCAQMLGSQGYPYLIASQTDLEHVAMSDEELNKVDTESFYSQWNTPIDENGNPVTGKVYYRLMGYVNLNEKNKDGEVQVYDRSFSNLENGYSLDGNGYSIRNLTTTLATELDVSSVITNITFENTVFEGEESLIGTLNGSAIGVNVFGTASGSNVAGIAQTVGESVTDDNGNIVSGLIKGCVAALDYSGNDSSNIAGLALTNNGTIEMSVSAGDISGTALSNVSGLVNTNNGTIKNSFTMGDIILDAPTGTVAGFVGTNADSAIVDACYTRCNFKVTNADVSNLTIGSFVGGNSGEIFASFAAGLFDVRNAESQPTTLRSVFAGSNSGTATDVMFDKQLSGTCFKDIFTYAERTMDIITLANHTALRGTGEAAGKYTVAENTSRVEYPQLTEILNTKYEYTEDPDAELTEDEKAEIAAKTLESRMYRTLRSYSLLSSATAAISNDNYIDNLAQGSITPLGFEPVTNAGITTDQFSWSVKDGSVGSIGAIDVGAGMAYKAPADANGNAVASVTTTIEDYHNGTASSLSDTLNLYFTVNGDGQNPNFADGNGSKESPYQISTKEQVVALSYYGKNSDSFFEVINDIDMTDTDWNAYIDIFKANLDGQGYALSNITIPADGCDALIGTIDGGAISNLGIAGIEVTTSALGASGLLAAKALNNASVTNCVVVGDLNAPTGTHAGGLIGETDGATVIDGCVVSGKITSGAGKVGGLIGNATEGTAVSNCLSTVLVDGGENSTAGGVLGGGTATVTNTVFAGNVKGGSTGNIAGDSSGVIVENSYFDKQLSMVDGGATASTTYYLTEGAVNDDFGNNMAWISGFVGYPVPAAFTAQTGYSDAFINAVKLASAKITLANGVGAGSSTAFTTATPTVISSAVLGVNVSESGKAYLVADTENMLWKTQTDAMALGEVYGGELTYTFAGMTRYVDVTVGKQVKAVEYTISGLTENSKSIISVITGNGDSATAATAFDTAPTSDTTMRTLCSEMMFSYDVVDDYAQLFRVETQLPNGYKQGKVTATFNTSTPTTVEVETDENGIAYIAVPATTGAFDTISITVEAIEVDIWGIRNLFGLFR